MENNVYQTDDLILAAYLIMKGHEYLNLERKGSLGSFTFKMEAKESVRQYYANDGRFKEFHNKIRDLKQQVKSL